jgi:hypothetical protein
MSCCPLVLVSAGSRFRESRGWRIDSKADVNDLLSMSDCAMLWGMGERSISNSLKPGTIPIHYPYSLDGRASISIVSLRIAGYSVYSWAKTKYEWNNSKEVSCGSTIARTPPCSFSSLASRPSRLPYQKSRSSSFLLRFRRATTSSPNRPVDTRGRAVAGCNCFSHTGPFRIQGFV